MSKCFNIDRKVVEIIGYEQMIRTPYVLNVFLSDWFNLPIHRIKEIGRTLLGYVYNLKYLKEALDKKDWREAYSIIASTTSNLVGFYKNIKRITDAYKDADLIAAGLFKVYIDPYIPLGFYVAIGKLLHKPLLLKAQRIYMSRYIEILKRRIETPQITAFEPAGGGFSPITERIPGQVKRTLKDLAQDAYKQFVEHNIKKYIEETIGLEVPPDAEDLAAFIASISQLRKPLGILYNTVMSVLSARVRLQPSPLLGVSTSNIVDPSSASQSVSQAIGSAVSSAASSVSSGSTVPPLPNNLSVASEQSSEINLEILGMIARNLRTVQKSANINVEYARILSPFKEYGMHVGMTRYVSDLPDVGHSVALNKMLIVPLNVSIVAKNKDYKKRKSQESFTYRNEIENLDFLTEDLDYEDALMRGPLFYHDLYLMQAAVKEIGLLNPDKQLASTGSEDNIDDDVKTLYEMIIEDKQTFYTTAAFAADVYVKSLLASEQKDEGNNNTLDETQEKSRYASYLQLMASSIIPIDTHKSEYDRLKSIMSSRYDILGIAANTIQNKDAQSTKVLSDLLEPAIYFYAKSIEATRRYLSISNLDTTSMVIASLEPFSSYIPPLPRVFEVDWLHELKTAYTSIYGVNAVRLDEFFAPVNEKLSIYQDILPLQELEIKFEDIATESLSIYGDTKVSVPSYYNVFTPAVSLTIYDTGDLYITNYFKAYKKLIFHKGGVRPPQDIAFILDVIRLRPDFGVQDLLSLVVLPSSIEHQHISYKASGLFGEDDVPVVRLELSVIGFITYTGVDTRASLYMSSSKDAASIAYNPASVEGKIDFLRASYIVPQPPDIDDAEKAARYALLKWYGLYSDLPIYAERLSSSHEYAHISEQRLIRKYEFTDTQEEQYSRVYTFSAPRSMGLISDKFRRELATILMKKE